jgi:protein-tyrosine phosphatase
MRPQGRPGQGVPRDRADNPGCNNVSMAWIELDGAVNARDLGGLPVGDGRVIAQGALLRSDNLQDLSPADIVKLVDGIGLTTVIDLRSTAEVESEGPSPLDAVPAVRRVHLSVLPEGGKNTDVAADALLLKRERDRSRYPDDVRCGHYLGYLEDRPESVVGALRAIAGSPGASIVHCAAGKDRTGVVAALTLTVAGVPAEEVIADYAATGERMDAILARLAGTRTYASDIKDTPREQHAAPPETMKAFLEQLDARYGGAAGYLARHGFGPDDIQRLRARLLLAADAG